MVEKKIGEVSDRVLVLEIAKEQYDKELKELKEEGKNLSQNLDTIIKKMDRMTYIVGTAVITMVASEIGLVEIIKVFIAK